MFSVCLRYAKNKEEAEDAFQQGFYLVYKNIKQLKNPEALSGWIKRIFVNVALEQNRKISQLRIIKDDSLVIDSSCSTINQALSNIATNEFTTLIQQLPVGCRSVFNLFVIEGYSHKEIAKKMEISIGTSKSQLHDAKKTLQKKLIKSYNINKSKASN